MEKLLIVLCFSAILVQSFGQKILICQVENKDKCVFKSKVISENDTNISVLADHSTSSDADITTVQFTSCNINFIPDSLFKTFPNLIRLHLNGQNVMRIKPGTFIFARKLEEIFLGDNKIEKIDADTFTGAVNLKEIQIFNNLISNVSRLAFRNLTNLEKLHLNNNKIVSLHQDMFRNLTKLTYLQMCCNQLEFVHKNQFITNLDAVHIFLHTNRINGMSNMMYSHLPNITTLHLANNVCINGHYTNARAQMRQIENDLRMCSITYVHFENQEILQRISGLNEKIDDNFNFLLRRITSIERSMEFYTRQLKMRR